MLGQNKIVIKKILWIVCAATSIMVLTGCASTSTRSDLQPTFVQKFADMGVSAANTRKIVLVGSEGGYGSNVHVIITEKFLIQEIWDTIYQSRPYGTWAASGFKKLRFYTETGTGSAKVELLVNETDRCHFEKAFDDAFRCPGINKILEPLLKAEYEKRKDTHQSLQQTRKRSKTKS